MLVLGACGPSPTAPPQELVVPLYEAGPFSLAARKTGTLQVHGPCLVVAGPAGEEARTVAWPMPGTTWDPSTQTISMDGVRAPLGALVTLVGGEIDVTELSLAAEFWIVPPAVACIDDPVWLAGLMQIGR